uniref:Uncharacterized protein n=1 Tax=Haptolina brevifila TaxID=156173 RepID=A0A7S2GC61_9EUKA|mmetsp:Transcript_32407/g.64623  ORF Transcript_32407/g.64623 Transcript_32407/m.64623 type:complete len:117 (+) Transcript_32407:331-681(+)
MLPTHMTQRNMSLIMDCGAIAQEALCVQMMRLNKRIHCGTNACCKYALTSTASCAHIHCFMRPCGIMSSCCGLPGILPAVDTTSTMMTSGNKVDSSVSVIVTAHELGILYRDARSV